MRMTNRLLMGVSTLPVRDGSISSSVYTWEGQIRYAGYSQLEPIIQMFYETKCKDTGDTLELILLCTEMSLTQERLFTMQRSRGKEDGGKLSPAVQYALAEGEEGAAGKAPKMPCNYTAVDYLIHRVKYYVTGDASALEREQIGCELVNGKESQYIYRFPEASAAGEEKLRFVLIAIDERNPVEGLKSAFTYLKSNREEGTFWIDTHGGFREIAMIMTALISLLRVENIIPERVLGVQYDQGRNCIVEQKQMIDINLFVAGMEEFINHGSTEILKQYYSRYYGNELPDRTKRWLEAMNVIADGTRLCDPKLITQGIRELKNMCRKYDRSSETEQAAGQVEDKYFDIFVDYIRKDYGELLTDHRISDLKIIKRCYEKKLYQQALTFVEACMPKYLTDRRLIYFDVPEEQIRQWRAQSNKDYEDDRDVFLFNRYMGLMVNYQRKPDGRWGWDDSKLWKGLEDLSSVFMKGPEDMEYHTCLEDIPCQDKLQTLNNLLKLHRALKGCRNHYNHASGKGRPDVFQVQKALQRYIAMVEELESAAADAGGHTRIK